MFSKLSLRLAKNAPRTFIFIHSSLLDICTGHFFKLTLYTYLVFHIYIFLCLTLFYWRSQILTLIQQHNLLATFNKIFFIRITNRTKFSLGVISYHGNLNNKSVPFHHLTKWIFGLRGIHWCNKVSTYLNSANILKWGKIIKLSLKMYDFVCL